jgi:hypothetical protein
MHTAFTMVVLGTCAAAFAVLVFGFVDAFTRR